MRLNQFNLEVSVVESYPEQKPLCGKQVMEAISSVSSEQRLRKKKSWTANKRRKLGSH